MKIVVVAFIVVGGLLSACDSEDQYDVGYSDGYATGYNTACKKGGTNIWGRWDDADYSRGFRDGEVDGRSDCFAKK